MADDSRARWLWRVYGPVLDGTRPSGVLGWVSPVAPVVTQTAVGAGHWAAGRRQRARAAWAVAAGYGLVAWGLGTEAPTPAEARQNIQQLLEDLLRKRGMEAPATAEASVTPAARHLLRRAPQYSRAATVVWMVLSVRWGLRHPRRLTVLAIASQAPAVVFSVLPVARAAQQRRPRIAAGWALVTAGSVTRLRAASAEPLR